jgi:branched-chain amino acid aminotransferase
MSEETFDDRPGFIWMNGEMVPWKDANLHVLSHALHYASSVFEGQRAYNGTVFRLQEHTERLHFSASQLGFEIPYSVEQINQACRDILEKQGHIDAYMRPVAWRGSEMMGVSAQSTRINLAIAVWEWPSYFAPEERLKGIRMNISKWKRPSPETIPCKAKAAGLYMICTLSKHEAERAGFADSLMMDYRGRIAEATGANVFFRMGDELHTPTPDCFLDGITRQTVIALAKARGVKTIERAIMPDEMESFEECFITGTAAEVTPVSEIGPYRFVPGELSKNLMEDYTKLVNL